MDVENVVARLAEAVERRFYGKYRGFVVDNDDPESLGRLRVTVPSVLGDEVVTGWATPCVPYGGDTDRGALFVPDPGAGVWIEFEEGDLEFPIWVGTFWSKPGGQQETPRPNGANGSEAGSAQKPPTRKIIKTSAGHTIQFEDADDAVRVIICDGQNENRIVLGSAGLAVVNKNNTITMSDDGITLEDAHGNRLVQGNTGMVLEDTNGSTITMDVSSGAIPPGVSIVGAKKVCLEGLVTWLMSHTHIGNMGAPCPVNPAQLTQLTTALAGDGNILSQKVTLG
jgi:uncharacterized protein involved in type VI secretion and phage assembly